MSLVTHYTGSARDQGVHAFIGRSAVDGAGCYPTIMQQGVTRRARADALIRGESISGRKLDGAPPERRGSIAADTARVMEWAEFYQRTFGAGASEAFLKHADAAARLDSIVPMASQGLTYLMPEVYKIEPVGLPCWEERFLAVDKRVNPAANEYVWYESANTGVARASSSYDVTTIPMVNGPIASDNKGLIVPALVGYTTNFMDPRREAFAISQGKPDFEVERMKREACTRTLAEFINSLWYAGDGSLGIDGLFNHPAVQTLALPGLPWSGKTSLQILADLIAMIWAIPNRSIGQLSDLSKIELILPPTQYQLLMAPITAAGDKTILAYFREFFQSNSQGVPKVSMEWTLQASNSSVYNGGPQVLAQDTALITYREGNMDRDPTFVLSQPIETPAPTRMTGVGDVVLFHARAGGLKLPDARRLLYVVGL